MWRHDNHGSPNHAPAGNSGSGQMGSKGWAYKTRGSCTLDQITGWRSSSGHACANSQFIMVVQQHAQKCGRLQRRLRRSIRVISGRDFLRRCPAFHPANQRSSRREDPLLFSMSSRGGGVEDGAPVARNRPVRNTPMHRVAPEANFLGLVIAGKHLTGVLAFSASGPGHMPMQLVIDRWRDLSAVQNHLESSLIQACHA